MTVMWNLMMYLKSKGVCPSTQTTQVLVTIIVLVNTQISTMPQQRTAGVSIGGGGAKNSPTSSPLPNSRSGTMPQESPNGGWYVPNSRWNTFVPLWYPQYVAPIRPPTRNHLPFPTYVKDINFDAHIHVFKKAIKVNRETISQWGYIKRMFRPKIIFKTLL